VALGGTTIPTGFAVITATGINPTIGTITTGSVCPYLMDYG
jgi:hypothetical protein